jgi:hypothetical protein
VELCDDFSVADKEYYFDQKPSLYYAFELLLHREATCHGGTVCSYFARRSSTGALMSFSLTPVAAVVTRSTRKKAMRNTGTRKAMI